MAIITKKQKIYNLLSALDLPDPLRSLEDLQKFHNEDLKEMNKAELWNERRRTELTLAMMDRDPVIYVTPEGSLVCAVDWLQERLKAIIGELRKVSGKTAGRESYKAPVQHHQGRAAGWI